VNKPHLSIVTPAYNCASCIPELDRRLIPAIESITQDYEIIYVDDGSPLEDWAIIKSLSRKNDKIRGIRLSRNYGQHYAITAGLDHVRGDWIVVMDCDLQDQPEEIFRLYQKAMQGYDIVFARRSQREHNLTRKFLSFGFTILYNWLGGIDFDNRLSNFSISSSKVIRGFCKFRERNRSFPLILLESGFRYANIDVKHGERFSGKSSYTLSNLLSFAIQCVLFRSNKPLLISIKFGFSLSLLSMIFGSFVLARYYYNDISVPGWTTLAILISFLGGLGFANLGVLGLYIGKVFEEVKNRPLYLVQESLNDPELTKNRNSFTIKT